MTHKRVVAGVVVGLLFVFASPSAATIYRWKGDGGVVMLSNDPDEVPPELRASAGTFTAKPAPAPAPAQKRPHAAAVDDDAGPASDAYERGYAQGLEAAERHVALAQELARTMLAAAPPPPAAPIIIEQPALPPMPSYPSYGYAGYGYPPYGYPSPYGYGYPPPYGYPPVGPFGPVPFGFPFGFGTSFGTPSPLFVTTFSGHRFGHFRHGNMMFSRAGFGRMR